MAYVVTAEPTLAFVDAVSLRLRSDATLMALVTGVYGHLSEAARTAYPYLVLGRRHLDREAGAMQAPGANVSLQIDVWSQLKGPAQAHAICSRVAVLLERYPLTVLGFTPIVGSLTCEFAEVFDEPDTDQPDARLYHGVQRWRCVLHETTA